MTCTEHEADTLQYRPEIDGLRAVAVISVILNHAGLSGFKGGFVGVDIFFVISGYLITRILQQDIKGENFTFSNFYERRARRILPALFVMIFVTIPFAWAWMYPSMLIEYSKSLMSVVVFLSNVHFWESSGYFDLDASFKPLLHTWSLAVEEQFYLLFPILLLLIAKWDFLKTAALLIFFAALSLALSEWGWRNEPDVNFFFTLSRLWEILAGAILAVLIADRECKANNTLAYLGSALIISAITMFDESTPFPSAFTLIPVLGAVFIIRYAQAGTLVALVLSSRVMVGIGLMSYSLYLWHQPLLTFARIKTEGEPSTTLLFLLVAATFVCGFLSWRFVEQPFRRGPSCLIPSAAIVCGLCVVCSVAIIGIGAKGVLTEGGIQRYSDEDKELFRYPAPSKSASDATPSCFLDQSVKLTSLDPKCLDPESSILLIGDSHAAALSFGLRQSFKIGEVTGSACPPLIGYQSLERPHCANRNSNIINYVNKTQPETVILHANWALYKLADLNLLADTITSIKQSDPARRVYVIGGVPQWLPSLPARLTEVIDPLSKSHRMQSNLKRVRQADERLLEITNDVDGEFISLLKQLCDANGCIATIPANTDRTFVPIIWDYGHLTDEGSVFLVNKIKRSFLR